MTAAQADNCFLYERSELEAEKGDPTPNFVILQVDDSLGNGDTECVNKEQH